jgi:hypothetical protein
VPDDADLPPRENPVQGDGSSFGALRHIHLWIVLEQSQGRMEATTYEQASCYPHPERFMAPIGFAPERLRYAKRVYKKTAG